MKLIKKITPIIVLLFLAVLLASCGTSKPQRISSFGQSPVWSPDGTRIAFLSDKDGDFEIYSMNVDGSDVLQLTSNSMNDQHLAWSPDGKNISYTSYGENNASANIYIMNSDGTNNTLLRQDASSPSWSPDGNQLVYAGHSDNALHIIRSDGSGESLLVENGSSPVWSPDGAVIAFRRVARGASPQGNDVQQIFLIDPKGGDPEQLCGSPKSFSCYDPVWSPDGQAIAYSTSDIPHGTHSLFISWMNSTKIKNVLGFQLPSTNNGIYKSWSPDGKRLTFDYWRNDQLVINGKSRSTHDLYTINTDGKKLKQLTKDTYQQSSEPVWSPNGNQITFISMNGEDIGIWLIKVK